MRLGGLPRWDLSDVLAQQGGKDSQRRGHKCLTEQFWAGQQLAVREVLTEMAQTRKREARSLSSLPKTWVTSSAAAPIAPNTS